MSMTARNTPEVEALQYAVAVLRVISEQFQVALAVAHTLQTWIEYVVKHLQSLFCHVDMQCASG